MKKQPKFSSRARLARSTASASGLALIMGLVNVAVGANTTLTVAPTIVDAASLNIAATGSQSINTSQFRGGSTTGTVVGSGFSDQNSGSSTIVAPGNVVSAVATSNTSTSTATSNTFDTSADFSINSAQAAVGTTGLVSTTISGSPLVNVVFSAPVNEATLNNNTANAATSVNQANASITQTNLQGFDTAVAGSASVNREAATPLPKIDVTANGMITNYQQATNAGGRTGSGAAITGASLNVDATSTDAGNLAAGSTITLAGNQAVATYSANDASSQSTGTGMAFDGSLAIANLQNNTDGSGTAAPTASITGSGVTVSTGTNAINGDVTVSKQNFNATSDGNSAVNSLALDVATGVTGSAAGSPSAGASAGTTTLSASTTGATVGIASAQGNQGANLASSITTSNITVAGKGGAGAITLSNNNSLASANGNTVANTLSLNAGNLDEASGTIANAQANTGTAVAATNDTAISVVGAGGGAIAHTGPVAISGNSIGSSAVGSTAANLTLVQADASVASTAGTAAFLTNNSQYSDGASTVTATTNGAIQANLAGATSANGLIADNIISSSAKVNVATNGTVATAGSGDYTARINNEQNSESDALAITTGSMLAIGKVNTAIPGSALTLSGNTLSASASNNEATNISSNTVAGALTMGLTTPPGSSLLSNTQVSTGATTSTAGNTATVLGIGATGAGDVLGNTLTSQAVANSAANTVALTAGTSLNAVAATASTLINDQMSRLSSLTSTTTGKVGIDVSAELQDKANVIGNTLQATGTRNDAVNTLALAAGTTTSGRGSIQSIQQAYGVTAVAVKTPSVGISMRTAGITGVATVSGNTLRASARQNQAVNDYSNTAGTTLSTGGGGSLLNSNQNTSGTIASTVGGAAPLSAANLGIVALGSVGGSADVLGNTLQSVAVSNSVQNTAALTAGTSLDLAAASDATLYNSQRSVASLTSTTRGSVGIEAGGVINGTSNVIDNTLQAIGTQNEAFNTLTLTAGTSISGDASLANSQEVAGTTTATVESAGVGILSTSAISDQATVNGNALQSQAIANLANNTLAIVSGTGSKANANISNSQTAFSGVTASTSLTGLVGVGAGGSLEGTATVGSNKVSALAFGNNAGNALNATGGAGVLNGNLSSSSTQVNRGAISATVSGLSSGPTVGVTAAAPSVAGYTANLLGNRVSSTAYGNSAENVLNALSTGAISASAQLASSQTNTGRVTAVVSNAGMGISGVAGAPAVAGRSVISGNTISATAVGNSSVSKMVIGQ
ncbi:S-layer family protein [Pusillimonas sp. ANT_WB101]|uniref:beta strand repeat-containing protein n=1 Tax=Pusillimonas sp. ANT_WB101 TaxID=2597356 RepID=UPI0011EF9073|nr:S-layer family protein [Pusillimonas sp. ANT_WB101]KAA0889399.1 S-layer family protein [Pusillimonas sp. ANT_WB101]